MTFRLVVGNTPCYSSPYQRDNGALRGELSCVEKSPDKLVDVLVLGNPFVVVAWHGIFGKGMQLFIEYRQIPSVVITAAWIRGENCNIWCQFNNVYRRTTKF